MSRRSPDRHARAPVAEGHRRRTASRRAASGRAAHGTAADGETGGPDDGVDVPGHLSIARSGSVKVAAVVGRQADRQPRIPTV